MLDANATCYHFTMMTLAPKIGLSLVALAAIAFGATLWAKFGGLVYFDTLAAAFIGCFI